jgi:hypothetical protein
VGSVYIVIVPLAGSETGHEIARCESAAVAAELVRCLLAANPENGYIVQVRVMPHLKMPAPF